MKDTSKKENNRAVILFMLGLAICLIAGTIFNAFFLIDKVVGKSMTPTYQNNQRLILRKYNLDEINNGDVVVFKMPDKVTYIKRVIAQSGDTIELKGKKVYVNDKLLSEPYTNDYTEKTTTGKIEIPEGYLFCMGDNRDDSLDSRYYGLVNQDDVIGVVLN